MEVGGGRRRKGQRVLYFFRTPPSVRVGREPIDAEAIRLLEQHNPDIAFDWAKLIKSQQGFAASGSLASPAGPGPARDERRRERRDQRRPRGGERMEPRQAAERAGQRPAVEAGERIGVADYTVDTDQTVAADFSEDTDKTVAADYAEDADKTVATDYTEGLDKAAAGDFTEDTDRTAATDYPEDTDETVATDLAEGADTSAVGDIAEDSDKTVATDYTESTDETIATDYTQPADNLMAADHAANAEATPFVHGRGNPAERASAEAVESAGAPEPRFARLGAEGLARLRARYADIRSRLEAKPLDEVGRAEVMARVELLNPDNWLDEDEVARALEDYEAVLETIRPLIGRPPRRRRL
jgi:hypothetical protein